jgi:two-component system sensor histidine kinase AtoS
MTDRAREPVLRMNDMCVTYNENVKALKGVNFDLYSGEIHAIVGEHRAGKSSLVKILSGTNTQFTGQIMLRGTRYTSFNKRTALRNNIAMFNQSLATIPTLNTVQYIFLNRLLTKNFVFSDYARMSRQIRDFMAKLDLNFDITTPLMNLSVELQNMVELIKVFLFDPDIIILDEISSRLTPYEMEKVYPLLTEYRLKGKSIIYITHYMNEVFQLADRVTILKDGISMGTERIENIDNMTLLKLTYSFVLSRDELQKDNITLYYLKMYNEQIIRNIPVGVIVLDEDLNIYLINNSALHLFGGEDKAKPGDFTELIASSSIENKQDIMAKIKNKEEYTWEEIAFDANRRVKIKLFPFMDQDGSFLGNIVLIEDISKEIFFKDYFVRTQKISSIAGLAAGIAHEINNPLGIIKNYLTLLKIEEPTDTTAEFITKILREISRINDIIGSLLSFSKFSPQSRKTFELVSALEDTVILLENRINEKSIILSKHIDPKPVLMEGDENGIRQVFFNLITNSIEAVEPGGTICISTKMEQNFVEIGIEDNGSGIEESKRSFIFEPFFSCKEAKKNAGLGLTICQHIVQAHNGIIDFTSIPKEKTTFWVRFPLAKEEQKKAAP